MKRTAVLLNPFAHAGDSYAEAVAVRASNAKLANANAVVGDIE